MENREFATGTDRDRIDAALAGKNPNPNEKIPESVDSVDNTKRPGRKRTGKPDNIALVIERVIRDVGQPMQRREIVKALEARDMEIPALDKERYIGTIVWRHKGTFVNVEGRGYWLRDEPVPPGRTIPDLLADAIPRLD